MPHASGLFHTSTLHSPLSTLHSLLSTLYSLLPPPRHSPGTTPTHRLNTRQNTAAFAYPTSPAITSSLSSVVARSRLARSILKLVKCCIGLLPSSFMHNRLKCSALQWHRCANSSSVQSLFKSSCTAAHSAATLGSPRHHGRLHRLTSPCISSSQ